MGVKGLWNYVEHHHIQYAYPNKNARATVYGVNPRHLLIDMNAVLHMAYDSNAPTTAATLRAVALRVDDLLRKVLVQDTVVLVYDGVAPLAKLRTQKERRRSLSVNPPRLGAAQSVSKKQGKSMTSSTSSATTTTYAGNPASSNAALDTRIFTCDLTKEGVPLQREEILCGSEFVLACEWYVTTYLEKRQSQYSWKKMRVCGCRVAGEGEVKISRLLRDLWQENATDGTYNADDAITIVGNDSDLILVSLVAVPYSYFTLVDPFDHSLTALRELMVHWCAAVPNPPLLPELLPSYRMDFVFIFLLSGDDYYEGIGTDSVALWRRYRHLRSNEGFFRRALVSGPELELDVEFMRALFARTGAMDAQLARVPRNKRKAAKAVLRHGTGGGNAADGLQLLRATMWGMRGYVSGGCADYQFLPSHGRSLTIGALRAASQTRGLNHKVHAGASLEETTDAESVQKWTSTCVAPAQSPSTPLEQCLGILGVRGRYSVELRRALQTATGDEGHTLTTSTSVALVVDTVKRILSIVDMAKLTEAERLLYTPQDFSLCVTAESGSGQDKGFVEAQDAGAFLRLAAIPSRRTETAAAAKVVEDSEDAADEEREEEDEGEGD